MRALREFVIRLFLKEKPKGVMTTLPNKELVDINMAIVAEKLMRNGIDPRSLKNANQVENAIKMIDDRPAVQEGITSTESAKVFNIKGDELDPNKPIIGGTQPGKKIDTDTFIRLSERNPQLIKQKIADKKVETDAEIKARLDKGNKEGIARIKNKKMVKDAIDNASPGFVSGDRKYNAQLVAEDLADKKFGKEFYDLDQRQQMDLYDEALEGLSEQTRGMPDPEDFAQGGRAGFDDGGLGFKTNNALNQKSLDLFGVLFNFLDDKQKKIVTKRVGNADGGRAGFKDGVTAEELKRRQDEAMTPEEIKRMQDEEIRRKINQYFNIEGKFKKPGKKQLKGAPEGVTIDREIYNFLINARIPVSEKVDLLTRFGQEKVRNRLERDDQELFLGEDGSKQRGIGVGFNLDANKGLSGSLMYEPDIDRTTAGIKYKFNQGGIARLGLKEGSGMTRRTFLKILGGAMAIPIVGKFLKPLKTAKGITKVPMIKTDNVPGKPEWFDDLVNKVIIEGDDVTKRFATGERQSIHQKTLDDGSLVRVTEDVDDGAVRVEYESKESMFGEPVQMQYKKPLPDEGAPDPTPEFTTSESGIVGRADGPDDFYLEAEEVGGSSIRDLDSDVSKLKEYATGKKPTMKEILEIKKRKDKVKKLNEGDSDATSQYVTDRQGDFDPSPDDFASGGIARMLGE